MLRETLAIQDNEGLYLTENGEWAAHPSCALRSGRREFLQHVANARQLDRFQIVNLDRRRPRWHTV